MVVGAALLLLVALGLFVAGLVTGGTVWFWACVAVAAVAAVLLFIARRQLTAATAPADAGPADADRERAAGGPTTSSSTNVAAEPRQPTRPGGPVTASASAGEDGGSAAGDPPAEEVEVTDLLLVVDMTDDVFVLDEHPRYHLADCGWLSGRAAMPLPVGVARSDGFTPCGLCRPDRHLAQIARTRRASGTT